MTELMTVKEVASYLRVNKKTIYRLLGRGNIPATKIGHQWRFDKVSIDQWIRQKSIGREARVLVVDDEDVIRELFKATLMEMVHRVVTAKDSTEGLEMLKHLDFDLVFLDLKMPGIGGAELFRQIKTMKPNLAVVIITGYPESDMMAQALAQSPFGVMNKPFSGPDIAVAVNNFLQRGEGGEKRPVRRQKLER